MLLFLHEKLRRHQEITELRLLANPSDFRTLRDSLIRDSIVWWQQCDYKKETVVEETLDIRHVCFIQACYQENTLFQIQIMSINLLSPDNKLHSKN